MINAILNGDDVLKNHSFSPCRTGENNMAIIKKGENNHINA